MEKTLYLHIKWEETREKNHSRAGDSGIYDEVLAEGGRVTLIGLGKSASVTRLSEREVTLEIPGKGEYIIGLNETASPVFTSGYQVAGDWVDERLSFEIKFTDMSLAEYEASLP